MNNKIYVGNLPYNTTTQALEDLFSQFGVITDTVLIKDRETGRQKGFGFVTFESDQSANDALQMAGKDFGGRPLKVNIAKDKPKESGSSGRRRRW